MTNPVGRFRSRNNPFCSAPGDFGGRELLVASVELAVEGAAAVWGAVITLLIKALLLIASCDLPFNLRVALWFSCPVFPRSKQILFSGLNTTWIS